MTQSQTNLTFEEYLTYDGGTDSRYELNNGRLIPMEPFSPRQVQIAKFIFLQFHSEIQRLPLDWQVFHRSVGVRTNANTVRIPDIIVLEGEVWRSLLTQTEAVVQVPPLVVVEVVSADKENRDRAYRQKMKEYRDLEIPEYWIVDPIEDKVTVMLLVDDSYQQIQVRGDDLIGSRAFSRLELSAGRVLTFANEFITEAATDFL